MHSTLGVVFFFFIDVMRINAIEKAVHYYYFDTSTTRDAHNLHMNVQCSFFQTHASLFSAFGVLIWLCGTVHASVHEDADFHSFTQQFIGIEEIALRFGRIQRISNFIIFESYRVCCSSWSSGESQPEWQWFVDDSIVCSMQCVWQWQSWPYSSHELKILSGLRLSGYLVKFMNRVFKLHRVEHTIFGKNI